MQAGSIEAQKQSLLANCDAHPLAEFYKAATDLYFKLPLKKWPKRQDRSLEGTHETTH